jgi:DNA-binding NtrC family response regulator
MATKRILIVDDEENIGRSLRMILEREGYGVNLCKSVAEFKKHPDAQRADAYLLDMKLPDGRGLDLLAHLDATPGLEQLPVVVLSGVEPMFEERSRSDRVVEWLIKPFAERELLRALRDAIRTGPNEARRRSA